MLRIQIDVSLACTDDEGRKRVKKFTLSEALDR